MKRLKGKLTNIIKNNFTHEELTCLGIYIEQNIIFVAVLISKCEKLTCSSVYQVELSGVENLTTEFLAEKVKWLCLKNNIKADACALCLPTGSIWHLSQVVPEMSYKELVEAVKYQVIASDPYNGADYWYDFRKNENKVNMAAISQQEGLEIFKNFEEVDLKLTGLTIFQDLPCFEINDCVLHISGAEVALIEKLVTGSLVKQNIAAIYTALTSLDNNQINLIPVYYHIERVPWKKLSVASSVACLFIAILIFSWNYYQISNLEVYQQGLDRTLKITSQQEAEMNAFNNRQIIVKKKENLIGDLTKERISCFTLLSKLGAIERDSLWLTEVCEKEKGIFVCFGKAKAYNSIVSFIDSLELEKDYFQGGAILEETSSDEKTGVINFKIILHISKK